MKLKNLAYAFVFIFGSLFLQVSESAATFLGVTQAAAQTVEVCVTEESCEAAVQTEVRRQNAAVAGGPLWGPVNAPNCEIARLEQIANERRCRSYDEQPGGKTLQQCATCLRQAIFDAARWEQCHDAGFAPAVPSAIYASISRLGRQTVEASQ